MSVENKNLLAWIQLTLSENMGPVTFCQLLQFWGIKAQLVRLTGIFLAVVNIVSVELELVRRLKRYTGNSVSLIYGG